MMTSLWRFNLPREPLWQALDLFSRPPDGLPECSERLQTAVHMAISLTDASGPMLSVLRVTAGDHGRRSHGEVTKKSIRPKLESRPLAPYLRPILTDHKWGNKIRFLKSRAGPTVTPSPSPESEPASETRNCTPRPELEVNTFHSISSFPKI